MDSETKAMIVVVIGVIVLISLIMFFVMGPSGCYRKVKSWKADAYGSDWLVVQYSQSGDVINYWVLHDKSIGSEATSDGIYFTDDDENVVHLSGHYVYIQINNQKELNAIMEQYLKVSTEDK